ncbi:MAG: hypothetical protein A2751_03255 [Candidatus Doudnabacteria bacterium RIFCSPHIGHO2_01_FULL_46_14]|uniref:SAM-dependent methyltransferase n=1 Tax=Candidatus Doudnabacteria bacterium RIFCSPHIGHO2_01_FULL_46_14 TaxID=1817824 RepID=A0A1F5NKS9_9BACT|nr:MAG: hypothetical protein A2751_03255 [Candidatus Doudnabacteria bacterium RIFCSPHIGHO2_01_FULL_46_14]
MNDNQKDSGVRTVGNCRICRSTALAEFFNLGEQPLANSFLKAEDLEKQEPYYPLRVLFCESCNLIQLGEVVNPELMFGDYVYFSSGMPASAHFRTYAENIVKRFVSRSEDLFVEIGSNDGHFLSVVKETHANILGIDPAKNIAAVANKKGIKTIPDFFGARVAADTAAQYGLAKVILGNNVVAHIDDHHDLAAGVDKLLAPDGVFIFEAPYLVDMFENLTFDTIYHEHLSYLAVRPMIKLLDQYNLEIFDVEIHPIQGQSIRVFAGRKGVRPVQGSVTGLINKELAMKLDQIASYFKLAEKIENLKKEVKDLVNDLKARGKRIIGYGAPAKGNTLLNYYRIGADILDYATEELPSKIGLYTPGTHIPVVHVSEFRDNPPDYAFFLAWNYRDAVFEKEMDFRRKGGKFIMPVGEVRML